MGYILLNLFLVLFHSEEFFFALLFSTYSLFFIFLSAGEINKKKTAHEVLLKLIPACRLANWTTSRMCTAKK